MNGKRADRSRIAGVAWLPALFASLLVTGLLNAMSRQVRQDPAVTAEIERLRGLLDHPGADGRDDRETAVQRLLVMPWPSAHRQLQQVLGRDTDPDHLRLWILGALQRQLLLGKDVQFGGPTVDARREILTGYIGVLARFWRSPSPDVELPIGPEGAAARFALQRINPREFEEALHALIVATDSEGKVALLRCIADLQQIYLTQVLAEFIEDSEVAVRMAARRSLRLLTFHEEEFASKAQFVAWYEQNRDVRYVDLAEQAARDAERRAERAREDQARTRIEGAREFVRAHTSRKPGIDWAAIQSRTLVDDPAVLDACLELLQQALATGLPADDSPLPRQAFCRALLQTWRKEPAEQVHRRSLLLEVAAYTARAEEADLAPEVIGLLLAQLEAGAADEQVSALRGLRRFPTVDTRARVVRLATALLQQGQSSRAQLDVAISTLSSRTTPRWYAPADTDPDKADWLALIRGLCTDARWQDLRDAGLKLALTLDARDQRVAEGFGLLLEFAKNQNLDSKFRSSCLIQLQGWRDVKADEWAQAMQQMLDDMAPEIRQGAAESLAALKDAVDPRRSDRIAATIACLRDHLRTETSPTVLRALVDSMQVCGREPQMPEKAIGALNIVLGELGNPVPPEQQFRVEPLLGALATIAGDARADRGQWLGACAFLEQFNNRQSLRLVLQNHAAADLAKMVGNADAGLADRARQAMQWLIRTALLKPPRQSWTASEDLQREALDVRKAFTALDSVEPSQQLDEPKHRLLRLEVELACGKFQEVVQRTTAWLSPTPAPSTGGTARSVFSADEQDRMRCLAAEAQLGLGKADLAAKMIGERDPERAPDPRILDLQGRIAKALFATDPASSVTMFEHVLKATPPEDAQFRARVLDWALARTRQDPATRAATLAEVERYAPLFDAQDCPPEQRDAFQGLRGQH